MRQAPANPSRFYTTGRWQRQHHWRWRHLCHHLSLLTLPSAVSLGFCAIPCLWKSRCYKTLTIWAGVLMYCSSVMHGRQITRSTPGLVKTHSDKENFRLTSHFWQSNAAGRAHPARLELYWQQLAIREHVFNGFDVYLFLRIGSSGMHRYTMDTVHHDLVEHLRSTSSSRIENFNAMRAAANY